MVDTTVLIAGTVWPRWSYEVLRHAVLGEMALVLCPRVVLQARANLQAKFPGWVAVFDAWLVSCAYEMVDDPSSNAVAANRGLVRQIEDVPIALSAIVAAVDCFVSEDKDFTERSATTKAIHQKLTIMRPVIFLREVMGWSREDLEKVRNRDWPRE